MNCAFAVAICILLQLSIGSLVSVTQESEQNVVRAAAEMWQRSLNSPAFLDLKGTFMETIIAQKTSESWKNFARNGWNIRITSRHEYEKNGETKSFVKEDIANSLGNVYCIIGTEPKLRAHGKMQRTEPPQSVFCYELSTAMILFGFLADHHEKTIPEAILAAIEKGTVEFKRAVGEVEFEFKDSFYHVRGIVSDEEQPRFKRLVVTYDRNDNPRSGLENFEDAIDPYVITYDNKNLQWDTDGDVIWLVRAQVDIESDFPDEIDGIKLEVTDLKLSAGVHDSDLIPVSVPAEGFPIRVENAHFDCVLINGVIKPKQSQMPERTEQLQFSNRISWTWIILIVGIVVVSAGGFLLFKRVQ